jgi:biopolymer transport protein ExbB
MFTLNLKKIQAAVAAVVLSAGLVALSLPEQAFAQAVDAASAPAAEMAPAVETPAAPVAAPAAEKVAVDNPYGIEALWKGGHLVDQITLVIMVLMSVASWYILVTKLIESFKIASQAREARATFFKAASLQAGVKTLREGSPFRFIAETGIDASEHHEGELTENIERNEWVTMSIERSVGEVQSSLQDGLAFLATVGSTAPFIGLFGTVMGIYNALIAIGLSGNASIDKVAGPVGAALIMTAIGLAVAVPAVLGYNWLVRRNKITMDSVRSFSADLHGVLMGAKATR